jgi:predicted Co/Zn/Cd cation transporter (cation efflux family)
MNGTERCQIILGYRFGVINSPILVFTWFYLIIGLIVAVLIAAAMLLGEKPSKEGEDVATRMAKAELRQTMRNWTHSPVVLAVTAGITWPYMIYVFIKSLRS